jgi:alkylhydroperoxidase family enzyme
LRNGVAGTREIGDHDRAGQQLGAATDEPVRKYRHHLSSSVLRSLSLLIAKLENGSDFCNAQDAW